MVVAFLTALALSAPTRLVVGLKPDGDSVARSARAVLRAVPAVEVRRLRRALVVDVADLPLARRALAHHPAVRWVEEDIRLPIRYRAAPNDPLYPELWHLHGGSGIAAEVPLDIEPAWDVTLGLRSNATAVHVALLDDGFALDHPDLAGRFLLPGLNLSNGAPYDSAVSPGSGDKHGTQTAGIIAANGNNSLGVIGVCPECKLVPVRLIGGGGPVDLYDIDSSVAADAIEFAVDVGQADVINNSWGPPDGNPLDPHAARDTWRIPRVLAEALQHALAEGRGGLGTVVVWAAGNGGELVTYDGLASFPGVAAVGAVDASGRRPVSADYGPPLFLVAPSSGASSLPKIWTTDRPGAAGASADDYSSTYGGTSASAAMVAGVAALVLAAYPDLTAAQVLEAMADSATKVDRGYDASGHSPEYGFGRVDPTAALLRAAVYAGSCTLAFELCNNARDDNCDGRLDEDCAPCIPDAPREQCDGRDNNCDRQVDEDFVCEITSRPSCAPCASHGQCTLTANCAQAAGFAGTYCFERCDMGEPCPTGYACDGTVCAFVPTATFRDCREALVCKLPERCDGLDNDCNGLTDDLPLTTAERNVPTSSCRGPGVCATPAASCVSGAWRCDTVPHFEPIEVSCDGRDNDCDGLTDEAPRCDVNECGCRGSLADPLLSLIALGLWRLRLRVRRGP